MPLSPTAVSLTGIAEYSLTAQPELVNSHKFAFMLQWVTAIRGAYSPAGGDLIQARYLHAT